MSLVLSGINSSNSRKPLPAQVVPAASTWDGETLDFARYAQGVRTLGQENQPSLVHQDRSSNSQNSFVSAIVGVVLGLTLFAGILASAPKDDEINQSPAQHSLTQSTAFQTTPQ